MVVHTSRGALRGLRQDGINLFRGVPYAAAPLRFAPPQEPPPWQGVLDCTSFGPAAVQAEPPLEGMPLDEARCLSLNIWAPADAAGKKLPVYVWIHGGGFAGGTGAKPLYSGAGFARAGIVAVTINYRLNALGFLATGETLRQYGTTGNWGLLDQLQALTWVQQNIEAFGGDPARVTVGGESAGAYSVSGLIHNPAAAGLFCGAILESGSMLGLPGNSQYARGNLQRSIEVGRQLGFTFGAGDDPAGLAALRAAPAATLAQLSPMEPDFTKCPAFTMAPVRDGRVVPQDPYADLRAGKLNRVNLLWGFNADEGSLFVPETVDEARYEMLAARMFGSKNAAGVLRRFPAGGGCPAYARAREVLAHGLFTSVMKPYADALAAAGGQVFGYHFTHVGEEQQRAGLGAAHGSEMPYVFGTLPPGAGAAQRALSAEMQGRFASFIKTGDPGGYTGASGVRWPAYDPKTALGLTFGDTVSAGPMPHAEDTAWMLALMYGEEGAFLT